MQICVTIGGGYIPVFIIFTYYIFTSHAYLYRVCSHLALLQWLSHSCLRFSMKLCFLVDLSNGSLQIEARQLLQYL